MKLHVGFDFWGAGNWGDDLMMAGFLVWLRENRPDVSVSCLCGHDLEAMKRRFPSVEWIPSDPIHRQKALRDADVWVGLGGSPFQSDLGPWLLEQMSNHMQEAKEAGLPCFLVGVGMNNKEAFVSAEAQRAFSLAERVWFRDSPCLLAAERAGLPAEKFQLGSDLAHLYCVSLSRAPQGKAALILHAPRRQISESALRATLKAHSGYDWTWQCQEARNLQDSETDIFEQFSADTRDHLRFSNLDYASTSLEDAVHELGGHKLVLSSRYHGSIVAAWTEARLCIFERNAKLAGLREDLGAEVCTTLSDAGQIQQALAKAAAIPRSHLLACRDRANDMLTDLFDRLD